MLNENGAQLSTPLRLTVETKAMGLGTKAEITRRYACRSGTDEGSRIMREPRGWERQARDKHSFDTYEVLKSAGGCAPPEPW